MWVELDDEVMRVLGDKKYYAEVVRDAGEATYDKYGQTVEFNVMMLFSQAIEAAQSGVLLPLEEAAALAECSMFNAGLPREQVAVLALAACERIRAAQAAAAGGI